MIDFQQDGKKARHTDIIVWAPVTVFPLMIMMPEDASNRLVISMFEVRSLVSNLTMTPRETETSSVTGVTPQPVIEIADAGNQRLSL